MVDSLLLQDIRQPLSSSNPTNRITHPLIVAISARGTTGEGSSQRPAGAKPSSRIGTLRPFPRRRRVEGAVLAFGRSKVPPQCHDNTSLRVDLSLWDGSLNEIVIEFGVALDRTLIYDYERKQARRREGMRPNARGTGFSGLR
jgi:hypothetical protein